jgi:hypothetical protein
MRAILLLLAVLSAATVVQSHSKFFLIGYKIGFPDSQNNNGDNNNDGNHWGNSVKGWNKDQWKNLSWYLKRLPQKQFFGMEFVLNITGNPHYFSSVYNSQVNDAFPIGTSPNRLVGIQVGTLISFPANHFHCRMALAV